MASYLRSWLTTGTSAVTSSLLQPSSTPGIVRTSPPPSDDEDGSATETEHDDDDRPPSFPSMNSAQRLQSQRITAILTDSSLMPPPPLPGLAVRKPGVAVGATSLGSSLAVPITTTKKPTPASKKREKVALAPGHSSLDWANLKSSGTDLRGVDNLMRIPPSILKQHNKRDDAWSAFNGKVYNITPYISFHPGGEKELMRVAGRDGTKLFASTHAWVNVDFMLDACLVGFLIPEPSL